MLWSGHAGSPTSKIPLCPHFSHIPSCCFSFSLEIYAAPKWHVASHHFFLSLTKVCNPLQDLNLGIFDWQAAYTLWSMLKPCPRIFVILLFMNDIIEGNGGQSSILLNSETTICIEPGKVTIEETTASTYHKTNFRTFRCREHISIIANNNLTYSSLELPILSVYQVSFSTWII